MSIPNSVIIPFPLLPPSNLKFVLQVCVSVSVLCSCLETPRDREAWWAAVYGTSYVSKSAKGGLYWAF